MTSAKEDGVDERTVDIKEENCEWLTPECEVSVKLEDHEERISVFKEEEECKGVTAAIKAEDLNDFSVGLEVQKHETEDIFKQDTAEESPSSSQPWSTNTGRLATQENSVELKSELSESEEKITEGNGREREESPGSAGINLQKNGSFSPPSFGQHSLQYKEKSLKKSARGSENRRQAFLQCSSLPAAGVTQTEAIKTDRQQVEKEIQIHTGKKCCAFALNLQLTMASKQVKSGSVGGKKGSKKIEIELKKKIIEKYERGVRVTDLAAEYKKSKSTISTILKQKEAIKAADVAKGVTVLTKQRPQVLEEVEKLLLVWLNEKELAGDIVSEAMLCEKARRIHGDLLQYYTSTSGEGEEFKASRGWFEKFRKRSGIHSVVRHGEAAISNAATAKEFVKNFTKFVEDEGYIPQQVFNCDETRLFWKRMPKRTYITQEEKAMPPVVDEILSMGKSMGLEVDNEDIEEVVLDHKKEVTMEELAELQQEQHKLLTEEQSSGEEEERAIIKSDAIKAVIEKWNECQDFFEKYHPDKAVANRVMNMMNDNVVSHFRRILMRRKRQVTLDRYFTKSDPPAKQRKTPETRENT
ncbi:uncharacterized protein LOC114652508 isoform X2 [Erpetoichthys calabaricus]|uniref:uncharacterized protein LOC114652508 isoform X2 n=1 Tax=Erpetoichthys calabaricus TaxID=27687 RepID=UPI0022349076|nr:uncharacterized protein LOC114652508 isoform X2 [Erpetoichthys calabaricus]